MKDFSASDTLLTALPVILVLLALVSAVVFFPEGSLLDIRGKAAPVVVAPTSVSLPTVIPAPETACSELYSPVCSQVDLKTYANECEAGLANALPVTAGECPSY
jgi:hypothetical protein